MRAPSSIETALRTLVALALVPGALVLLSGVAIVIALLGGSDRRVHRAAYLAFARLCHFVGSTDLHVHGADHIDPERAYVIVPNHESNWDPPTLIAGLPLLIRFIVKQQMMAIPVFGQALRLTGNVIVERNRSREDVNRIRKGMQERTGGVSMLFFAEGSRSRDGRLHEFKMGAFAAAIAQGLPILPVAVAGSYYVMPPGLIRLRRGPVVLEIGEPVQVEGLVLKDRAVLRDQVRELVAKLRARAYARIRDEGFPVPDDL
jgi:1-acyl-sn-glycerol-3-phosphate acyltransferase